MKLRHRRSKESQHGKCQVFCETRKFSGTEFAFIFGTANTAFQNYGTNQPCTWPFLLMSGAWNRSGGAMKRPLSTSSERRNQGLSIDVNKPRFTAPPDRFYRWFLSPQAERMSVCESRSLPIDRTFDHPVSNTSDDDWVYRDSFKLTGENWSLDGGRGAERGRAKEELLHHRPCLDGDAGSIACRQALRNPSGSSIPAKIGRGQVAGGGSLAEEEGGARQ